MQPFHCVIKTTIWDRNIPWWLIYLILDPPQFMNDLPLCGTLVYAILTFKSCIKNWVECTFLVRTYLHTMIFTLWRFLKNRARFDFWRWIFLSADSFSSMLLSKTGDWGRLLSKVWEERKEIANNSAQDGPCGSLMQSSQGCSQRVARGVAQLA